MSLFPVLCYFIIEVREVTLFYMKHMPVILLSSLYHASLYNMCNFDCYHFMVINWANIMNSYIIYALPPVLRLLWEHIATVKIVDYKYLPVDFFRKEW